MMYTIDCDIIEKAREQLNLANNCYAEVWDASKKQNVKDLQNKLDSAGYFSSFRRSVTENKKNLMTVMNAIKLSLEDYEKLDKSGKGSFASDGSKYSYGVFADMMALGTGVSYAGYQIYQFESSGKSLTSDFNDLYAFKNTLVYQCTSVEAGMGEWSNYGLYLDTLIQAFGGDLGIIDNYTDEMLESALAQVLMSLPDSEAMDSFETLDELATYSGIENLDKWISALKKILSTYAEGGKSFDDIKLDENFQKLMSQLPADIRDQTAGWISSAYAAQILGDTVSELTDKIERLDTYIDVIMHCLNDYSVQVSYLDTMEDALLSAGFSGESLLAKIREMKENYQNEYSYAMDKVGNLIVKEVKTTATKEIIKKVSTLIPCVKDVDLGLSLSSTVAQLENADEISAIKGLGGLYQYDYCLSAAYQNYVDMMNENVATEADMQEADKIYTLLKQTKIKEYDYMLTLCERRDQKLFEEYHVKYTELTGEAWNNHAAVCTW